jgi:inner membrane protein
MQKTLLLKIAIILGLMLVVGIPLAMIQSTIQERSAFRDQAVASIAADSVREQQLTGPVLVVPYTDEYEEEVQVASAGVKKTEILKRVSSKRHLVFPNDLQINGTIETDHRYRGIHKVLVYSGQHAFAGDFLVPAKAELPRDQSNSRITLGKPFIALSIEDVRGIRNIPKIIWDGKAIEFQQGTGLATLKSGLHANLDPIGMSEPTRIRFSFGLGLDGIERQNFTPIGKNNVVTIKSNWPHPQFTGRFLPSPKDRTIDAHGFSASWSISSLATGAQQQLLNRENAGNAPGTPQALTELDSFSIGFIEPVNVYSLADRATKYGLLFVALTFAVFFVFEILKGLPIHPIQYALVGLALVLFFLLLLGLSEHIQFVRAYLAASAACIVLIGFYLAHVLRDWRRGFGFGAALTALYGALYGLLISENNALVLGSILLFAVLAAIMIATRKVDWYQIGKTDPA